MPAPVQLSEADRLRVVNALAFYWESLGTADAMPPARLAEWREAMACDHPVAVDALADRFALSD